MIHFSPRIPTHFAGSRMAATPPSIRLVPPPKRQPTPAWVERFTFHTQMPWYELGKSDRWKGYDAPVSLRGFTLQVRQAKALGRFISEMPLRMKDPRDTFQLTILKKDRYHLVKEMLLLTYRQLGSRVQPFVLLNNDRGTITATQYVDADGGLYIPGGQRSCVARPTLSSKYKGRLMIDLSSGEIGRDMQRPSGKFTDRFVYPWANDRRFTRKQLLDEGVSHGAIDLLAGR